jgi:lipopolysaccharide export system ATP-binding protein
MVTKMLETIDLSKSYEGKVVVDHLNLKIHAGEIVGLLGPNGAGKTTAFYMILNFVLPDVGKVLLNGEDIGQMPTHQRARKGITYLSQESSIFRGLNVEENILLILEGLGLPKEEKKRRLKAHLMELNITPLAKKKANLLSGGERRRVEITRALALSPSFMLLDEPFAGIDPISVIDIQNIIHHLTSKKIGIVITDHNVREAFHICDKIYILHEGKILEAGPPEKIAASKIVRSLYLGENFTFKMKADRIPQVNHA